MRIQILVLALICLPLINCGQGEHKVEQTNLEGLSNKDFFEYPYQSKPEFFADIALLKPASQVENLSQFKFVGAVSYVADPSATVSYTVRIKNESGATLCPTQTGKLTAKQTLVQFDCVSAIQTPTARVEFVVSAAGKSATFKKEYLD